MDPMSINISIPKITIENLFLSIFYCFFNSIKIVIISEDNLEF